MILFKINYLEIEGGIQRNETFGLLGYIAQSTARYKLSRVDWNHSLRQAASDLFCKEFINFKKGRIAGDLRGSLTYVPQIAAASQELSPLQQLISEFGSTGCLLLG